MRVTVRYFATHQKAAGVAREVVDLREGATVDVLVEALVGMHPALAGLAGDTIVSVNRGVGTGDTVLREGDDVTLFPPITGG